MIDEAKRRRKKCMFVEYKCRESRSISHTQIKKSFTLTIKYTLSQTSKKNPSPKKRSIHSHSFNFPHYKKKSPFAHQPASQPRLTCSTVEGFSISCFSLSFNPSSLLSCNHSSSSSHSHSWISSISLLFLSHTRNPHHFSQNIAPLLSSHSRPRNPPIYNRPKQPTYKPHNPLPPLSQSHPPPFPPQKPPLSFHHHHTPLKKPTQSSASKKRITHPQQKKRNPSRTQQISPSKELDELKPKWPGERKEKKRRAVKPILAIQKKIHLRKKIKISRCLWLIDWLI